MCCHVMLPTTKIRLVRYNAAALKRLQLSIRAGRSFFCNVRHCTPDLPHRSTKSKPPPESVRCRIATWLLPAELSRQDGRRAALAEMPLTVTRLTIPHDFTIPIPESADLPAPVNSPNSPPAPEVGLAQKKQATSQSGATRSRQTPRTVEMLPAMPETAEEVVDARRARTYGSTLAIRFLPPDVAEEQQRPKQPTEQEPLQPQLPLLPPQLPLPPKLPLPPQLPRPTQLPQQQRRVYQYAFHAAQPESRYGSRLGPRNPTYSPRVGAMTADARPLVVPRTANAGVRQPSALPLPNVGHQLVPPKTAAFSSKAGARASLTPRTPLPPPSLLAQEHYVHEAVPVLPKDSGSYAKAWDATNERWKVTVFPAQLPVHREQVLHLRNCLNEMLDAERAKAFRSGAVHSEGGSPTPSVIELLETSPDIEKAYSALHSIYALGMHEVARQVSSQCSERGQLMMNLWISAEALRERMAELRDERSGSLVESTARLETDLAGANTRVASLEMMEKHHLKKSEELTRIREQRDKLVEMMKTLQGALANVEEQLRTSQAARKAAEAKVHDANAQLRSAAVTEKERVQELAGYQAMIASLQKQLSESRSAQHSLQLALNSQSNGGESSREGLSLHERLEQRR